MEIFEIKSVIKQNINEICERFKNFFLELVIKTNLKHIHIIIKYKGEILWSMQKIKFFR